MAEYRVDFTITRRLADEDDFSEIGFGSSSAWVDVVDAARDVEAIIQNRIWETAPGMPDPTTTDGETT